jgi:hypothetical protein
MVRNLTEREIEGYRNWLHTRFDYPLDEWKKDNR